MATEANVLINIEGRPYMLSKHLKKSSLIEIITKLQEDLTKIKEFTKCQTNYKAELDKLKLENKKLQEVLRKDCNNKENRNEINCKIEVFKEQAELRERLKENYEKQAFSTAQLYEEKIDLLRKRVIEIEKDRETFAEAIEIKQSVIKSLKKETERLRKDKHDQDQRHKEQLRDLKQKGDEEKQKQEREKQKLIKEKDVLQRTYIDLDKIRKYLEKNNTTLKNSISEINRLNDDRFKKLAQDYEEKEAKHLEELKKMRHDVEIVVQEAEGKIERIEKKLEKNSDEYQTKIAEVTKSNDHFKQNLKNLEQSEKNLKSESSMYQNLVEQTRRFYEDSIRSLNEKFYIEKDKIEEEMSILKDNYESKINDLKTGKDQIEGDTNQKARRICQLEAENKFMSEKIVDLKIKSDESNKKYLENYSILKEKVELIKNNYETEKFDLKTQINSRDKLIDDLNFEIGKLEKQIKSLIYSNDLLKQENDKDLDKIWLKIQNQKDSYTEEIQKLKENHNKKIKLIDNDLQQAKIDYEVLDKHYNELLSSKKKVDKTCEELREKLTQIEDDHQKEMSQLKEDFMKDGKFLKQDFEKQSRELQNQTKQIQNFQNEITKLKSNNEDLQKVLQNLENKNLEEVARLNQIIEDKSNFYKEDLQNMKQLLSYKEEIIKKLEEKMKEEEMTHNLAIAEKLDDIKSMETNHEIVVNEIRTNFEVQKQKYDILIYEFYKELKEQQFQTDELQKIKSDLEQENLSLKKRNSDIIINITKQKDKFQDDLEIKKLLEYLLS